MIRWVGKGQLINNTKMGSRGKALELSAGADQHFSSHLSPYSDGMVVFILSYHPQVLGLTSQMKAG